MPILVAKITTGALDKQQNNLFNIISGNFGISKQQIAEFKKEINELKENQRKSTKHKTYWKRFQEMVPRLERDLANIEEGYAQEMYDYWK